MKKKNLWAEVESHSKMCSSKIADGMGWSRQRYSARKGRNTLDWEFIPSLQKATGIGDLTFMRLVRRCLGQKR